MTSANAGWDTPETDARVEELLAQLTIDDKISLVTGEVNWDYGFYARPLDRLGIPALQMADGPAGVRINRGDVHEGRATQLPAPIALAATWDVDAATDYATVIGVECRTTDHNVSLGPAVDIARVPIGGRTFESYGEDPLLAARTGVAFVKAVQAEGVQACAKHYAINNQEDHRSSIDAVIDERTMMELYLPPFEALVQEGQVASMMASFNRVNGTFACDNSELLTDILRDRLGFRGWIMSDYGANHSTAESANAGLDQEQPGEGFWGAKLWHAWNDGEVSEETLDEKVRRILRPLIGMGQLENRTTIEDFDAEAHHDIAQSIAERSMVLLRNDGVLPLRGVRKIALIGSDVDDVTAKGGGSSQVLPTKVVSPLAGLREAFGDDVEIVTAYGSNPITPAALLPGPDAIPASFFTAPNGDKGLHADFYTSTDFSGDPLVSRTEGAAELLLGFHNFPGFNASSARYPLLPGELNNKLSVRYTGTLTVPVTGDYEVVVTSLGSYTLSIGGVVHRSKERVSGALQTSYEPVASSGAAAGVGHAAVSGFRGSVGGGGGTADAAADLDEIVFTLEAGAPYDVVFEYATDHPAFEDNWLLGAKVRLGWNPPAGVHSPDVEAATALAREADVAIIAARSYEAEGDDRPHMGLPSGQNDLIASVLASGTPTVVVLMTGSPIDTTVWGGQPNAILQAWFPGQAQGGALANVLTGVVEPGGRLPLTVPASLADTPVASARTYPGVDGHVHYDEGVLVGYRAQDAGGLEPTYAFGHGLGYTTFAYSDLSVAAGEGDAVGTASVTITNTGDRAGSEIVQVYAGKIDAPVLTPPKQLAGYAKVSLQPGESARVEVPISRRSVSYYDVDSHDFVTPAGRVEVLVGASSRDIRLTGSVAVG
ncbi:glycoside hydrolase family 3 protein [Microbacterium sp.]|uniref:beta-glucosidase n=1 Tax=Microbacterium sp. TaxID=51671 RepID=UPI0039E47D71